MIQDPVPVEVDEDIVFGVEHGLFSDDMQEILPESQLVISFPEGNANDIRIRVMDTPHYRGYAVLEFTDAEGNERRIKLFTVGVE
jgi:hypothetical protein